MNECITKLHSPVSGSHDCNDMFLRVQSKRGRVLVKVEQRLKEH